MSTDNKTLLTKLLEELEGAELKYNLEQEEYDNLVSSRVSAPTLIQILKDSRNAQQAYNRALYSVLYEMISMLQPENGTTND